MPPKLSDPDSTPRFPHRGDAKRQKPIWTREQFGPWQCNVRVTPITGLRRGYPVLEVSCSWEHGPPLLGELGAPIGGMAAVDQYVIDRESPDLMLTGSQAAEFSIELARRSADLLAEGVKPDLAALARAILQRLR